MFNKMYLKRFMCCTKQNFPITAKTKFLNLSCFRFSLRNQAPFFQIPIFHSPIDASCRQNIFSRVEFGRCDWGIMEGKCIDLFPGHYIPNLPNFFSFYIMIHKKKTFANPSCDPETIHLPSGLQSKQFICNVCPLNEKTQDFILVSQTFMLLSQDPLIKILFFSSRGNFARALIDTECPFNVLTSNNYEGNYYQQIFDKKF